MKYQDLQDYQKRYIQEYAELDERCKKCQKMVDDYASHQLMYTPTNSLELSVVQLQSMVSYRVALRSRIFVALGKDCMKLVEEYKRLK